MRQLASIVATLGAIALLWNWAHEVHGPEWRLPSMREVLRAAGSDRGLLFGAAATTVRTVGLAVAVGAGLGLLLGLLVGISENVMRGPYHFLNAARGVPVTALLPLFLGIFGLFHFLVPILTFPIVVMMAANVAAAVRTANANRFAVLRLWGVRRRAYVSHVLMYEMMEPILLTLRVAIPFAIALEVALDYFLNLNSGLGKVISLSYQGDNLEGRMYAAIGCVAALGIASVVVVDSVTKRVLEWKRDM